MDGTLTPRDVGWLTDWLPIVNLWVNQRLLWTACFRGVVVLFSSMDS